MNSGAAKTKKPKTKRVVEGEGRQGRFIRLAKSRSDKFLSYFELLHNLVEGYAYQVEPELAKQLLSRFEEEFVDLSSAWKTAIEKAEAKKEEKVSTDETPALPVT